MSIVLKYGKLKLLEPCAGIVLPFVLISVVVGESEPGSSVGIATDYGLEGPGSNPGGDGIFYPSRPALVPTQPPVKWVPVLSWG